MKVRINHNRPARSWRLLLIILISVCSRLNAQTPIALPADSLVRTHDDHSTVRVRQPDTKALESYRSSREYQYDRDTTPPQSVLAKFWAWLSEKIGELFQSRAYRSVGQYVLLLLILGTTVWLLYKADVVGFIFPKKAVSVPLDYEHLTENIHEISFDDRIDEALAGRNYRLAVRLLYLQTLKRLTDRNLIAWQPDKTNRQYAYELASPLRADFEQLTTQFEFVWYGDFPIDERRFAELTEIFNQFNSGKLNLAH